MPKAFRYDPDMIQQQVTKIWAKKPHITYGTAVRYARRELRKPQ